MLPGPKAAELHEKLLPNGSTSDLLTKLLKYQPAVVMASFTCVWFFAILLNSSYWMPKQPWMGDNDEYPYARLPLRSSEPTHR